MTNLIIYIVYKTVYIYVHIYSYIFIYEHHDNHTSKIYKKYTQECDRHPNINLKIVIKSQERKEENKKELWKQPENKKPYNNSILINNHYKFKQINAPIKGNTVNE